MQSQKEKVSYIIGRQIGGDFRSQGIEVDFDSLVSGLKSAAANEKSALSDSETQAAMDAFQAEMAAKKEAKDSADGQANRAMGEAYLAENAEKVGVVKTASGLQYRVIQSGSGKKPSATDTVETHYEGRLIDGTVFDSSYQRGQTTSFPVNRVIAGWSEALQLMSEGDIWELTIPSELAYGSQGAGGQIGPHAVLTFKIELIAVR